MEKPAEELERLGTVDAEGRRLWVYPSDVHGRYRSRRTAVAAVLLVIFLVLPWIKINGAQALLVDIVNRRFALFGLALWAHDAPLLVFIAVSLVVCIALVTAIWGRAWCGWACPQTVFVDMVFRRIERRIEGDAVNRRKLDNAPWSGEKLAKKAAKWSCYGIVSLVLSHSFLAYFVGTETLARMIRQSPADNPGAFLVMLGMFALVLFDFGWFREQFCTVVCPYGRFQTVMLDENSLVVAYDRKRGEPRKGSSNQASGDCVNCRKCVQVCPTGIDIRNGLQMECIACTACVDACDSVMLKLKKPVGLIGFGKESPVSTATHRARVAGYIGVLALLLSGLAWMIGKRDPIEVTLIRAIGEPYQMVASEGHEAEVVNHFRADLLNQTFHSQTLNLAVPETWAKRGVRLVSANAPSELKPGQSVASDLFIRFPKDVLVEGRADIELNANQTVLEVRLVGPFK